MPPLGGGERVKSHAAAHGVPDQKESVTPRSQHLQSAPEQCSSSLRVRSGLRVGHLLFVARPQEADNRGQPTGRLGSLLAVLPPFCCWACCFRRRERFQPLPDPALEVQQHPQSTLVALPKPVHINHHNLVRRQALVPPQQGRVATQAQIPRQLAVRNSHRARELRIRRVRAMIIDDGRHRVRRLGGAVHADARVGLDLSMRASSPVGAVEALVRLVE
jgi:hypothetical protein